MSKCTRKSNVYISTTIGGLAKCSHESAQSSSVAVYTEPMWKAGFVLVTSRPIMWNIILWKLKLSMLLLKTCLNSTQLIWHHTLVGTGIALLLLTLRGRQDLWVNYFTTGLGHSFPWQFFPSIDTSLLKFSGLFQHCANPQLMLDQLCPATAEN